MNRLVRPLVAATVAALAVACAGTTPARPSASISGAPPKLSIRSYASGFGNLTFVTNAGDGSGALYAVEQVGRIVLVTSGSTQGGQTFLDLTDRIASGGERGLLGLASSAAKRIARRAQGAHAARLTARE